MYSVNKAAQILGISRRRLRTIIANGVIVEIGGKCYRARVGEWGHSRDLGLPGPSGLRLPESHLWLIRYRHTKPGPARAIEVSADELYKMLYEAVKRGEIMSRDAARSEGRAARSAKR